MASDISQTLSKLGLPRQLQAVCTGTTWTAGNGSSLEVHSPVDRSLLASFAAATPEQVDSVVARAHDAFRTWRAVPAPQRGEFVRRIGERLREVKQELGEVVSWEAGKIVSEARGEVQEMIDICDFAVGLSRQLYGKTIASERPEHRLTEQWHPLGPIGVITAFNFPVAVWAWNAMIALVCGDTVVWKPSEKTPLCAMACQAIAGSVLEEMPEVPPDVVSLIVGDGPEVGKAIAAHPGLPLISATGSVPMGRAVGQVVAARLGRSLLELGGNNAMIVTPSADLDLAIRSLVFSAVGTAGQRCTTLRRLIVHDDVYDALRERIVRAYEHLPIGNPLDEGTLVGPLIDEAAVLAMGEALEQARLEGGVVTGGGRVTKDVPKGAYVKPALVEIAHDAKIVQQETFAPILYLIRYQTLGQAIEIQNSVPQGLASAIATRDVREAELFCSAVGSDCGIVNVNIGTSGAEIGGAFGGEKETGGGRESGSDSWKAYMRRATNTVNFSKEIPLAQGVRFDLD